MAVEIVNIAKTLKDISITSLQSRDMRLKFKQVSNVKSYVEKSRVMGITTQALKVYDNEIYATIKDNNIEIIGENQFELGRYTVPDTELEVLDLSNVLSPRKLDKVESMFRTRYIGELILPSDFSDIQLDNMDGLFKDCRIDNISIDNFDTSKVTSMKEMFKNSYINSKFLNKLNTKNVKDMSRMFENASCTYWDSQSKGIAVNLDNLDYSNVESLEHMFDGIAQIVELIPGKIHLKPGVKADEALDSLFSNVIVGFIDLSNLKINDGDILNPGMFYKSWIGTVKLPVDSYTRYRLQAVMKIAGIKPAVTH